VKEKQELLMPFCRISKHNQQSALLSIWKATEQQMASFFQITTIWMPKTRPFYRAISIFNSIMTWLISLAQKIWEIQWVFWGSPLMGILTIGFTKITI
jgi:hypothetical protein